MFSQYKHFLLSNLKSIRNLIKNKNWEIQKQNPINQALSSYAAKLSVLSYVYNKKY